MHGVEKFLIYAVFVLQVIVEPGDELGEGGDIRLRGNGLLHAHDGEGVLLDRTGKGLHLLDDGLEKLNGGGGLGGSAGTVHTLLGFLRQ